MKFEFKSLHFDISLDQWTRVSRSYIEPEDPWEVAKAEEMETSEEYYRHWLLQ